MTQNIALVSLEWDVVDLIESVGGYSVQGFFDPSPKGSTGEFAHLGPDSSWPEVAARIPGLKVAMSIDDPKIKAKLFDLFTANAIVTLQSPSAYVSARAVLGHGAIIQRGVTIMPNARLGTACKINVNATLHHDVQLGDFCTVAPGAQLLGNVSVGPGAYVGAGAIIRQRTQVGAGAFIGAGAVVVKDVPPGATVVGVPASRRLR